ncbi:MAG: phosphoribosyltransferase family protein [Saprospiraceae bacterium]
MDILDNIQIKSKIKRMAYQVIESNFDNDIIYLLGINNNGYNFAKILEKKLKSISDKKIKIARLTIKTKNPIEEEVKLDIKKNELNNQSLVIVDDVANTGSSILCHESADGYIASKGGNRGAYR